MGQGKNYSSVLLSGLPSGWFHDSGISDVTKRDILSGVAILQQSCCDKDSKKAILKTCTLTGQAIQSSFPDVRAAVIYKESSTLSLVLEDPSYSEILIKTSTYYGVKWAQGNSDMEFVIMGNLDTLVDFRKAFDEEIIKCGAIPKFPEPTNTSEATSIPPTPAASTETPPTLAPRFNESLSTPETTEVVSAAPTADHGLSSLYPASDYGVHENLNPDILAVLEKNGIPGIIYYPRKGLVYVENDIPKEDFDEFRQEYQNIASGNKQIQHEVIPVPKKWSDSALRDLVVEFDGQFSECAFLTDAWQVKIVSLSSQELDQAKKDFSKRLREIAVSPNIYTVNISKGHKLTLRNDEIVTEEVDVIVNSANELLKHTGGMARAINEASGGVVQQYCDDIMSKRQGKPLDTGDVVTTEAGGSLKCRHIIHAIGPGSKKDFESKMKQVVENILREAQKLQAKSVAIPAIRAGLSGMDGSLVAKSVLNAVLNYKYPADSLLISDIRVVIFDLPIYPYFADYLLNSTLHIVYRDNKASPECEVLSKKIEDLSISGASEDIEVGKSEN